MNHSEDSYRKLSTYHLLLFPTHWVGEGFPGVVLDAYLAGLPVIATDWNMNSEVVIPGETGWLIPSGNPQALADAIQTAVSSCLKLTKFSKNSREKASLYDVKRIFSEKLLPILLPDAVATSGELNV
jgi:glycosyltransferase involved in cell wall biosynthesis